MNNKIDEIIHELTDRKIRIVFIKGIIRIKPGEITELKQLTVHK